MNHFINGSVVCNLKSTEKYDAIRELIQKASVFKNIKNIESFKNAVIEREKEMTTGFGHQTAFTHGKTDIVDRIYIGLGISQKGINFNSVDKKPVHFLFMLATPLNMNDEYLKILCALCKLIKENDFYKKIITMQKCSDIEKMFHEKFKELKIC